MNASPHAVALFGLFVAALAVLLIGIDLTGGVLRVRSRRTQNPEDARTVMRGAAVSAEEAEPVARAARAHRNAMANILPFVLVMAAYVALGASPSWVIGLCAPFTAARLGHAIAYLRGAQPWRSASFFVATSAMTVTLVQLVRSALVGM